MPKRNPKIDAYISKAAPFARPILEHLRDVVHEGCPEVVEELKWNMPHFEYKGMFCGIAAFKQHATFGFWRNAALVAEIGPLRKSEVEAMGQFGRITSLEDLPSRRVLVTLVKKAARFNDERHLHPVVKKKPRKPVRVAPPAWFMTAVRKNKRAFAGWQGLSPSRKKDYVGWLTEAKSDETRARRMATALEWMSEGKSRNWKYERK